MRFPALLALLVFLSTPSWAQSRVVGDTFKGDRAAHQETIDDAARQWEEEYRFHEKSRIRAQESRDMDRAAHQMKMETMLKNWEREWMENADSREAARERRERDNAAHQAVIEARPQEWWYGDAGLNQ